MYEAGHHIDNAASSDEVAATRAFFNFTFFSVLEKQPVVKVTGIPPVMITTDAYNLTAVATSPIPTATLSYQWISSCGGGFSDPTSPNRCWHLMLQQCLLVTVLLNWLMY